ncbi:hypothetical protein [Chitinophaga sancti]|uniref:hypothetical protein n=1 Tax=Chitinophaga sancti TaxID=1004 RepID=UPI003F79A88D
MSKLFPIGKSLPYSGGDSQQQKEHGTVSNPPDANQGTATTSTPIGNIVLSFNFDTGQAPVAYTIEKKPFIESGMVLKTRSTVVRKSCIIDL